jgi:hypothetical protein
MNELEVGMIVTFYLEGLNNNPAEGRIISIDGKIVSIVLDNLTFITNPIIRRHLNPIIKRHIEKHRVKEKQ